MRRFLPFAVRHSPRRLDPRFRGDANSSAFATVCSRLPAAIRHSLLALALLAAAPAFAVEPDEMLADPALEARARAISAQLRCLVCQNQSIDDSQADLARDLRLLVRERLKAGDSDAAVKRYLVARYGDFILLKPPLKPETLLLWGAPGLVLLGGLAAVLWGLRRRAAMSAPEASALSEAEKARLAEILSGSEK
jgi:cytochrome c-type biogenesis protein CcmH